MKTYIPKGVCSSKINFRIEGGILSDVSFAGGCHGNLQGIAVLVEGMPAEEAAAKLEHITCGFKSTSCPAELAKALKAELALQSA